MKLVIHMLITLTLIGILSGGLLSQISEWAEPKIEAHRKAATEKAIFNVQPEAGSYEKIASVNFEVYKVFDGSNNPLGFALPYEGSGFQGNIRLMLGIDNDLKRITGMTVLEQIETPGLGTKIIEDGSNKTNPFWFPDQFKGAEANPLLTIVKNAAPSDDSGIQAITGATISSRAVVTIVNSGIEKLRSVRESGGEL